MRRVYSRLYRKPGPDGSEIPCFLASPTRRHLARHINRAGLWRRKGMKEFAMKELRLAQDVRRRLAEVGR